MPDVCVRPQDRADLALIGAASIAGVRSGADPIPDAVGRLLDLMASLHEAGRTDLVDRIRSVLLRTL
jgi:hypothetical protein